jgi:hypothetical protein
VPLPLALVVIARRPAALVEPPLRARRGAEAAAAALRLPFAAGAALVVREPAVLDVQPHALPKRRAPAAAGAPLGRLRSHSWPRLADADADADADAAGAGRSGARLAGMACCAGRREPPPRLFPSLR